MPSLRARMINALLRVTVKPRWRSDLQIAEIRRRASVTDRRLGRGGALVPSEEVEIAGRPARWFGAPELATQRGTLLYLHGGAWVMHLPTLYQRFCAQLCLATGLRVLLLDYRLAPEHPYPAAIDDGLAAYRALVEGGLAPAAIAGDSAGGSLTLVTLMRARDAGLPLPACAVLLSPSTDLTISGASAHYNADADPMFSRGAGDLLPAFYCPGQSRQHPWLSPLFGQWHGLPPLYFVAASTEMLLDDSIRAQDRAVQAGVDAQVEVWPEVPHVFPLFSFLPEARAAMEKIVGFVNRHADAHRRRALPAHPDPAAPSVPVASEPASQQTASS
jgi:acetyl esterase/lipase